MNKQISVRLRRKVFAKVLFVLGCLLLAGASTSAQISSLVEIPPPEGTVGSFGQNIILLTNGNFVATDVAYSIGNVQQVGAVYLYDGRTGNLISKLRGTQAFDTVGGGGVTALSNGDFVVGSPAWKSGDLGQAGAATYCSGTLGCNGEVTAENSIIGTRAGDKVGQQVVALNGGSFVIVSFAWNFSNGAVTLRTAEMGTSGTVSAANSVIGNNGNDRVGGITKLPGGNFLISSAAWNGNRGAVRFCQLSEGCVGPITAENSLIGANVSDSLSFEGITVLNNGNYLARSRYGTRGSITWGSGSTGARGEISPSNSLVGASANDHIGSMPSPGVGIYSLTNGNYVVLSRNWHYTDGTVRGAVTFCDGSAGRTGLVTEANSLIGASSGDLSQSQVMALANGNYVVSCPTWSTATVPNAGAVTFGNGSTGTTGVITEANSFVGDGVNNLFSAVAALSNGNYVIASSSWNSSRGAAALADGTTGLIGTVSPENSLIGSEPSDGLDLRVYPLANGNYVVANAFWDNGSAFDAGAVTLCSGSSAMVGHISTANSLTGQNAQDRIGDLGVTQLANGNFVIRSSRWNGDRGALTWKSAASPLSGAISSENSLVGSVAYEGMIPHPLPDGNFLVVSTSWQNNRGLVRWASGVQQVTGTLEEANSLVGNVASDYLGSGGIRTFPDGFYAVVSPGFDQMPVENIGAVTFGKTDRPVVGRVNSENSVIGFGQYTSNEPLHYDPVLKQVVMKRGTGIVIVRFTNGRTLFDYDGDGRSDISVFRPTDGNWYLQRSTAGFYAVNFGISTDRIVPADYDGDGKTDVAVYRPSTGIWYVVNSSDGTFSSYGFGLEEDLPAPADYDGDGKADISVFRPSTGTWYRQNSRDGSFAIEQFGTDGDRPTVGDFDGDGRADLAVFRPASGAWYQLNSSDGSFYAEQFGISIDKIVPADYDGDGKTDIAIYRPADGLWYVKNSGNGTYTPHIFGLAEDIPVPGDYDGDGKSDIAVFRPSNGHWYITNSSTGTFTIFQWGQDGDKPTPSAFQ